MWYGKIPEKYGFVLGVTMGRVLACCLISVFCFLRLYLDSSLLSFCQHSC